MRGALVTLALLLLATSCGGDGDASETTATGECESVEQPAPRQPKALTAPAEALEDGTTYALTFETNCGTFVVDLDTALAPNTAASLVALAGRGYFDDTVFHRIVPGFVIQGGDPTQTGSGGPGYKTVDPPPADSKYTKGTFAMAKTQAEPAGTAGSQFFVVTGEDVGLRPDYAIVGDVTEGLDVVERIGELGGADERPTRPVVIRRVVVNES